MVEHKFLDMLSINQSRKKDIKIKVAGVGWWDYGWFRHCCAFVFPSSIPAIDKGGKIISLTTRQTGSWVGVGKRDFQHTTNCCSNELRGLHLQDLSPSQRGTKRHLWATEAFLGFPTTEPPPCSGPRMGAFLGGWTDLLRRRPAGGKSISRTRGFITLSISDGMETEGKGQICNHAV